MRRVLASVLTVVAGGSLALSAHASPAVPLSTLPRLASVASSDASGKLGWLKVEARQEGGHAALELTVKDASTCFDDNGGRLERTAYAYGTSSNEVDVFRLLEARDGTMLERMRLSALATTKEVTVMSRTRVKLREVRRSPNGEVLVWAFRDPRGVSIVSRTSRQAQVVSAVELDAAGPTSVVTVQNCGFAMARMTPRAPALGAVAQIAGSLEPRGKGKERVVPRFVVDASVSRVTRDPETLLAVRIRLLDAAVP